MADGEAGLGRFLGAAGRSLGEAQQQLVGTGEGPATPTTMAISEVELEVKATFEGTEPEEVTLRPLTSGEARGGGIDPGAISTVRVRYVALAEEPGGGGATRPQRSADAVIDQVRSRGDLEALDRAHGELDLTATFVPAAGSWLVQARDRGGRIVRELAVSDSES